MLGKFALQKSEGIVSSGACLPLLEVAPPLYPTCVGVNASAACAANVGEELASQTSSQPVSGTLGGLAEGLVRCGGIKNPLCLIEHAIMGGIKDGVSEIDKENARK